MKLLFSLVCLFGSILTIDAQTLFTYGSHSVSKEEFLKAFEKNNSATNIVSREKDVKSYLELYIRFRLKVQEAIDLKLDTLETQRADVENFRKQIEGPYLNDAAEVKRLTEEAFTRSQKDIHLAHIFIPFRSDFISNPAKQPVSPADSLAAKNKITEAYGKLQKGEDFGKVAIAYSIDPSAQFNKGDLGFITVFSLPYQMENVAYGLTPGKISEPFLSSAGYHIFKNIGERPAAGKMKIAQILIAYNKNGGASEKTRAKNLSDSLYKAIVKGASFDKMAVKYSYDNLTNASGGAMPVVSVGEFDMKFEEVVFSLKKDGEIAAPFETENGFHIIKRLQHIPVEKNYAEASRSLQQAVERDKRFSFARESFEKKAREITGMKKLAFNAADLFAYTDSFQKNTAPKPGSITDETVLLEFPKEKIITKKWLEYAAASRTLNSVDKYPQAWQEFENDMAVQYYAQHLEDYNSEYALQMKEFKEGNLLFEIMERKVWSVSASDTAGLRKYYNQHKSKYTWKKSADALMVNTSDSLTAVKTRKQISTKPSAWRKITEDAQGNIMADSGRVEWTQIPAASATIAPGLLTKVVVNEDRTASFTYVIKTYTQSSPRSFEDARGLVMNDYQLEIEEKWMAELRKKYPVKINEEVLQTIVK